MPEDKSAILQCKCFPLWYKTIASPVSVQGVKDLLLDTDSRCRTQSDLGKGAGQLYFVYDSKAKAIEFCTADTPSLSGGYPDTCDF